MFKTLIDGAPLNCFSIAFSLVFPDCICVNNVPIIGFYRILSNFALSLKTTSMGFDFFITNGYLVSRALLTDASLNFPLVTVISKLSCMLPFKSPVAKRYFCRLKLSTILSFITFFMAGFSR